MEAAQFVAIFVSLLVSLLTVFFLVLSGKHWRAEQDRARERRMAEHRMNARLLRLNI
jgi:predicted PurR-regulated permease PerM